MEKMPNAEIWTVIQTGEGCAVLLRPLDTDIVVPVFIGQLESQSILIGKEGYYSPRPLTHDLFLNLLSRQDLVIERVEICEIIENIFHARIVICGGKYTKEQPLSLDSRPSDALALAVRCKCPILISADIVKQTGISLELILDSPDIIVKEFLSGGTAPTGVSPDGTSTRTVKGVSAREKKLRMLQAQLNAAVAKEDYERAAELRDLMRETEETEGE
jgi:bifunctional DNase/RNase